MKIKVKILLIFGLVYLLLLLFSAGYYKTSCTCSYQFYFSKLTVDCAKYCDKYKEISGFQKIINILLFKN